MIQLNNFRGFWIHWYKMVTGIELIRYQTEYRPNEHLKQVLYIRFYTLTHANIHANIHANT